MLFTGRWTSDFYMELIASGTCTVDLPNYQDGKLTSNLETDMTFAFTGLFNNSKSIKARVRVDGLEVTTLSCSEGAKLSISIDKVENDCIYGKYVYEPPKDTGTFVLKGV